MPRPMLIRAERVGCQSDGIAVEIAAFLDGEVGGLVIPAEAACQVCAVLGVWKEIDDRIDGERVDVRVATGSAARGNERARKFVVDELVLAEYCEATAEVKAGADGEVTAPGDVGLVIADGSVKACASFKGPVAETAVAAAAVIVILAAARAGGFGRRSGVEVIGEELIALGTGA
jgi:hypothetical protein